MSKNRPHARRAARSRAFQVLYSLQFSPSTTLGDVRTAFLEMPDPTDADMDENAETREEKLYGFAWELVEGVWSNVKNLDSVIERFSQNWRVDRLGKIELTLLRLAVFEMLYRADVPPKVAINEALELSTRFGDAKAKDLYESPGRFATWPRVSGGYLTIAPRVNTEEGTFYGITALDLDGGKMVDQLVMPQNVSPFEAVYMNGTFAFSVEANYGYGGGLGNMGTFIGREGGPFVYLSREPLACVAGKGSRYLIKARSSHFVVDTEAKTYAILPAPDKATDYGDYHASEGETDRFVTFATVRGDNGLPAAVQVRVFPLA